MKTLAQLSTLGLIASAMVGCGAADASELDPSGGEVAAQERLGQVRNALGTCYGDTCTGRDPGTTGCETDAYTVASSSIMNGATAIGTIALRFSPSCNAAWARTSTTSGAYFLRAEITRDSPFSTSQAASPTAVSALRSPMIGVRSGSTMTAVGRIGPQYNFYPYTGNVSSRF